MYEHAKLVFYMYMSMNQCLLIYRSVLYYMGKWLVKHSHPRAFLSMYHGQLVQISAILYGQSDGQTFASQSISVHVPWPACTDQCYITWQSDGQAFTSLPTCQYIPCLNTSYLQWSPCERLVTYSYKYPQLK